MIGRRAFANKLLKYSTLYPFIYFLIHILFYLQNRESNDQIRQKIAKSLPKYIGNSRPNSSLGCFCEVSTQLT